MKSKIVSFIVLSLFATVTLADILIISTPNGSVKCIVQQGVITCL
jgi:hypothetical protein